jgi:hypothetical protein
VNIPANVTRHFKSQLVIEDVGASRTSAETRMGYVVARMRKVEAYIANGDYEAAATFSEAAVMIAFEAWLMYNRLKLSSSEGSHRAMADIVGWLAKRSGELIETWELHDLVEGREAILYRPWDTASGQDYAEKARTVAAAAVRVLAALPLLREEGSVR